MIDEKRAEAVDYLIGRHKQLCNRIDENRGRYGLIEVCQRDLRGIENALGQILGQPVELNGQKLHDPDALQKL